MSEANREVVRRIMAASDGQDWETMGSLVSDDFVAHIAGMPDADLPTWKQNVGMFYAAFSELSHPVQDMVAEGDKVAVRSTFTGVHTGEFLGIPASGRAIEFQAFFIMRIQDGKATEEWGLFDIAGLMQQMTAQG